MGKDDLHVSELKKSFSGQKFFRKKELRNFYRAQEKDLSEKAFRRILYHLEKQGLIQVVDAGVYILGDGQAQSSIRKKFPPNISAELEKLSDSINKTFPYTSFLIWETRILHEFMLHQPGQSQIILETEKETTESIFNYLYDHNPGKVFLDPNRETFERYILNSPDSIIVSAMITETPLQRLDKKLYPKLEKILVDIFVDDEKFFVFQGQELINIYEAAFNTYRINEKTLFRYAKRRKADQKIRIFINQKTNIRLILHGV